MRRICIAILISAVLLPAASAQQPPKTGRDLLQTMHDAYAGRWFTTLIFTQRTTKHLADGRDTVATWYESLRYTPEHGAQLRIDIGPPADGNGVLYTADSVQVFRAGKLTVARTGGNALIPLIQGVYVQPVERTIAELAPTGVDLSRRVLSDRWNDRPVWIAGAKSASDTASPQFWVDVQTLAVVRAMLKPVPTAPVMDAQLERLVRLGGGWLATRCEFYVGGKLTQTEEYGDWQANVVLSPELFEAATYATAPHWAAPK